MLFAAEGGGFFSSSASGYSKGLTLLLLGQKTEEKPMRVSPWNQYQLVEQESDPDLQLASGRNRLARGCATFVCFRRTSSGLESPSPLKVGPAQQQDVLQTPSASGKGKDHTTNADDGNIKKVSLRSSLKKPPDSAVSADESNACETVPEKTDCIPDCTERRVQWTDACGKELVEIREFEPRYSGDPLMSILNEAHEIDRMMQKDINAQTKKIVMVGWQPPPVNSIKLNTDGSAVGSSAAAGGILRDSRGIWISGFQLRIGTGTPESAELWGLFEGLNLTWESGYRNVIAEIDSKGVFELVNAPPQSLHPHFGLIEHCKELIGRDWTCSIKHILREGNKAADWLAKAGFSGRAGLTRLSTPPPGLVEILESDGLGNVTPRSVAV